MKIDLDNEIDLIESAAWLVLDVADYVRQTTQSPASKWERAALRTKINRQLALQETGGDPLQVVARMRNLMSSTN